jgi:hypothetical protein
MEKAKMIVQCKNWNNSATTRPFHHVRSALERSTPVDEIQVLNHQNPANIAEDTIILQSNTVSPNHHVCCNKLNNLTADRPFYYVVSTLETSTPEDAFLALHHQNPTNIDDNTTILVIIL